MNVHREGNPSLTSIAPELAAINDFFFKREQFVSLYQLDSNGYYNILPNLQSLDFWLQKLPMLVPGTFLLFTGPY